MAKRDDDFSRVLGDAGLPSASGLTDVACVSFQAVLVVLVWFLRDDHVVFFFFFFPNSLALGVFSKEWKK